MPNVIKVKANKYIWQSENALILVLENSHFVIIIIHLYLSYANIAIKNLHLEHFNHDMPMLRLVWFFPQTLN